MSPDRVRIAFGAECDSGEKVLSRCPRAATIKGDERRSRRHHEGATVRRAVIPSRLHEDLLRLFENRPTLAAELARDALHATLPSFTQARVDSSNLNDIRPAEYRADLVVLLLEGRPVQGIVVEVQLGRDEEKEYVWPAYVCNLHNRIRSPACLLVMTVEESVAR